MAKTKATQTMIDEDFESQFKISDYQRDLKAVESSSRQADKLLKGIAVISMERQLECNTEEERDATRKNNIELWSELDLLIRRQNICRAIALLGLILSLLAIFL